MHDYFLTNQWLAFEQKSECWPAGLGMIASLHGNASPHVTAPTWQSCIPFALIDIAYLLGMVSNSDQLGFLCCYVHACCASSFLLCQHLLDILCCVCVAAHIQNTWFAQLLQQVTTDTHVASAISLCSMLVLYMWVLWQSAALKMQMEHMHAARWLSAALHVTLLAQEPMACL